MTGILKTLLPLALLTLSMGTDAFGQPTAETRLKIVQAASGPADLRLTGAATGAVGQPVVVTVSGLPAVDLAATVGEQTKWIDSIRFEVSTPDGKPANLDKELSMSVSPWEWRLRLTLTPPASGVYLIVCDWNQEPYGLALHRVTVGGTAPLPFDPTDPDDPNPPPLDPSRKPTRVTYVFEKDQSLCPRPVSAALQQLNAAGSVVADEFEDDTVDGTGQTPDQYKTALAEATKAGLPALVVEFSSGLPRVVKDPKTAEQVTEALKP